MTVMISKARILRMIDNCSCCIHNQYDARQFGLLNQQYQHGGTTLSIHRCVLSVTHLELTQISSRTTWRRYASHEANHFYKRYITMTNWYIYIYISHKANPFHLRCITIINMHIEDLVHTNGFGISKRKGNIVTFYEYTIQTRRWSQLNLVHPNIQHYTNKSHPWNCHQCSQLVLIIS